ncbi:hydrogenase maturation protease [Methylomarinum sp. Ch1-1]|uniref:Hydrogenase maturation protease n=1 Tax=Methylomarinum roseum TaxID=3067653 RepID=A0AAU7NXV7_9GAMM|nr:hydrogenase maturation protease [Methylomarinum sp. Ch1-1]MDP4522155.1 hydrogenase maturation protease [Methylomarinum sp. Ch1-1]
MTKPVLLFGYGNLSRGDDALGPLLLEFIERNMDLSTIEILDDFQLQIEHALDLQGRQRVLFVDAAVNQEQAFVFSRLSPCKDESYSSHALSPTAVLHVYQSITGQTPPPAFLLSIQGVAFELGEALSVQAQANLQQACRFSEQLLKQNDLLDWLRQVEYARNIAA